MRLLSLLALLALSACATVPQGPPPSCAEGNAGRCRFEATQHLSHGERDKAVEALGHGCAAGLLPDCVEEGELLLADGKLEQAEPPLQRAKQEGWSEAYAPLARLHEARGGPEDVAAARRLRWDALSLDHPDAEVTTWYRWHRSAGVGLAFALNLQPMFAWSRRLGFGFQAGLGPAATELNGYVGYQHFATEWLVPYGNVQVGWGHRAAGDGFVNVGAEAGLKLALGPLGHLNLGVGSSRASPAHLQVGIGLNYLLVLLAALH